MTNGRKIVPADQLSKVAALAPSNTTPASGKRGAGADWDDAKSNPTQKYSQSVPRRGLSRLDVERWLNDRGVEYRKKPNPSSDGRTIYVLKTCPFGESHGANGEVAIMQAPNGQMSAICMHNSCQGRGWQDFKKAIGKPDADHYDPPLSRYRAPETAANANSPSIPEGTRVRPSDRENIGTVVADHGDTCEVHFRSPEGNEATKTFPKSDLRYANGRALDPNAEPPVQIEVMPSDEFANADYQQKYLITGVLVEGQPAIVGGRSKTLKTSIMVDMALSLGTGAKFLGKFDVPERKTVALLSGESGKFTIQETAKRIAEEKGIDLAKASVFWGFQLPQLASPPHLDGLRDMIAENDIDVVMIDPAYLCLMAGDTVHRNAANVFDMGPLLLELSKVGEGTGTTIILCHHCRKNSNPKDQLAVPELEDLSMAGFAEWARQWFLLGRRSEYKQGSGIHELWLNFGGSAGHSGRCGLDIDEGQLLDDFTGRTWEVDVRTEQDVKEERKVAQEERKQQQQELTESEHRSRLLEAVRLHPEGETKSQLRDQTGLNSKNFGKAITALLKEGRVETCMVKKNNREYEGYK